MLKIGDRILISNQIENSSKVGDICEIDDVYIERYSNKQWCNYTNQLGNTGGFQIDAYLDCFTILENELQYEIC